MPWSWLALLNYMLQPGSQAGPHMSAPHAACLASISEPCVCSSTDSSSQMKALVRHYSRTHQAPGMGYIPVCGSTLREQCGTA